MGGHTNFLMEVEIELNWLHLLAGLIALVLWWLMHATTCNFSWRGGGGGQVPPYEIWNIKQV